MNDKKNETNEAQKEKVNLAKYIPVGPAGIALRTLDEIQRFAKMAVVGGAVPRGMTEGSAVVAIIAGLERGLGYMGGLQQCVVINGTLSWRGQGAFALIQNSPKCKPGTLKKWTEGEGENMKGVAEAWHTDYHDKHRVEFTVNDARQAGLWGAGDNWKKYPKRMLMWRALGLLARDVFPDVLGGFPIAEEAQDFEPVQNEKPPITAKVEEVAKPSAPDPLLQNLEIPQAKAEPQTEAEPVEAEVVEEPEPPPFESHEEADAQLAKEQSLFE